MNTFTNVDDPLTFGLLIPNEVGVATYSTSWLQHTSIFLNHVFVILGRNDQQPHIGFNKFVTIFS
jgi:hypothetical protein